MSYEKALELNWFERMAYEVAEFYENRQEYEKAIPVYNRIIEEGGTVDMAKTRLVNLYLTTEENDKALELLRELRTILPESHNVDITISRILLDQKKYDEAIIVFTNLLNVEPENSDALYYRAFSNIALKNFETALTDIEKFIAINSKYGE